MSHAHETEYGYWTVLSPGKPNSVCRCVCGKVKSVNSRTLRTGASRSCGCKRKPLMNATRPSSYLWQRVEWVAWKSMVHRCTSPKAKSYAGYGGRGITVCDRWLGPDGYANFLADMGPRPDGQSLERLDVDKGYSPENCTWIPRASQADNKRQSRWVEFEGERLSATRLAERLGLPAKTVFYRLDHGWTVDQIVTRPAGWRPAKYNWSK